MANFSKSFNFRNGVQVDNDKFIVKPVTGLVGIGNTRPSELLDVAGNIRASGITSARDIFAGAGITVGYANSNRIMLDIDPLTGVSSITAQRFYGDGSNMSGIFAISVAGFVANDTNGGILTSFRKVGIGVTTPTDRFDVEGDSKFTGITTFVGISTVSGDLFSTNLGVLGNSNLKGNLTVGSAITVTSSGTSSKTVFNSDVDIIPTLNAAQRNFRVFNPVGEAILAVNGNTNITAVSGKFFNIDTTILRSLSVATGSTFTGDVSIGGNVTSDLTVSGLADLNNRLDVVGGANIDQLNVTGVSTIGGEVSLAGVATFPSTSSGDILFTPPASLNSRFKIRNTAGVDVFQVYPNTTPVVVGVSGKLQSIDLETSVGGLTIAGVSTLTGRVNATEINSPTGSQLKILQDGIQKFTTVGAGVSVSNTLRIGSVLGGTSGLSTHHGEVSYGSEGGLASYSGRRALNVANFDVGNLNYYLNVDNIKFNGDDHTGDFNWLKGSEPIMTLTGITRNLGIGVTNPSNKLEVIGTSRFTEKMILNNVDVGDTPVAKILYTASTSQNISGIFSGSHYGNIIDERGFTILSKGTGIGNTEFTDTFFSGNVHTNSGISTMKRLRIGDTDNTTGTLSVRAPALEEPSGPSSPIFMVGTKESPASQDMRFQVKKSGQVGIKTSVNSYNEIVGIDANNTSAVIGMLAVGFGATDPVTSGFGLDLTYAGRSVKSRQMVLPKVNTTERDAFEQNTVGAVIYNTQIQKIQVYTGSSWETVSSS